MFNYIHAIFYLIYYFYIYGKNNILDKAGLAIKFLSYLKDPIKLIEENFRTQDGTQGKYVPLKLFPKQHELVEKCKSGSHILVNKPRQAGISTVIAAYIAAIVALSSKDDPYRIIIVANKGAQAQDFLVKIKDFLTQVPRWVWGENFDDNKEVDGHLKGKGSVKSIKLFNGCQISAVATSKDAVRGQSSPRIIVLDEAAHLDKVDSETMYASAMMSLSSNAKGQMFLISTPNATDPIFFKTYTETIASNGANKFKIHEMYFFQDPRYNKNLKWKYKNDDKEEVIVEETVFDNDEMEAKYKKGWMPVSDWFVEQCAIMHNDKLQINRELLCKFDGSGNNVVDFEHIIRHEQKYVCEPIRKEDEQGNSWVFEDPIENNEYVAFADSSTAEGTDFCGLQIVNITTGEQAFEYRGKLKSEQFANIIYDKCNRYNALLDVDTTGGYGENLVTDLERLDFKLLRTDENGKQGFKFTNTSRPKVYQRFVAAVENDLIKIKSIRTIAELKTFVWINNRPDHMRGFNDDLISSLAGALWLFETHFKDVKKASKKDISILNAWINQNQGSISNKNDVSQKNIVKKQKRYVMNGVDMSQHLWLLK